MQRTISRLQALMTLFIKQKQKEEDERYASILEADEKITKILIDKGL